MAAYCTRIYVKTDSKELMEKLCAMDVSDLGKGYYQARDIFKANSTVTDFFDGESGINESDLIDLVERVVEIIKGHGIICADTFSYDYDPLPQVCYYNGGEIFSKLLGEDGGEFVENVDIRDTTSWIQYVENAEDSSFY